MVEININEKLVAFYCDAYTVKIGRHLILIMMFTQSLLAHSLRDLVSIPLTFLCFETIQHFFLQSHIMLI